MSAMVIMIGFSLAIAVGFLIAFMVSTKRGQFEDMHTPSIRMLFDDELKDND